MKYYICLIVAYLLLSMVAGVESASTGPAVSIPVPSSFAISESGKAIDNGSDEYAPGPGPITFTRTSETLYVTVPAPARDGMRLVSLEDRENGIAFRNNTLLLPIYVSGKQAGSLVAATETLIADSGGFSGQVTGLELRPAPVVTTRDGTNFTAGAVILLQDLPAGAEYRISFADTSPANDVVSRELEARGMAVAETSPPLALEGIGQASKDAIGHVIVNIQADGDWPGRYSADDVTLYRYNDSELSRLQSRPMRIENSTVYQATAPGAGQYILVAALPADQAVMDASAADTGVLALLGGLIAVLLIVLAVMVRRVARR